MKYKITNGKKSGVMHMVDVYDGDRHIRHYNVFTIKRAREIVAELKLKDK
jgi:hypothetical protein